MISLGSFWRWIRFCRPFWCNASFNATFWRCRQKRRQSWRQAKWTMALQTLSKDRDTIRQNGCHNWIQRQKLPYESFLDDFSKLYFLTSASKIYIKMDARIGFSVKNTPGISFTGNFTIFWQFSKNGDNKLRYYLFLTWVDSRIFFLTISAGMSKKQK